MPERDGDLLVNIAPMKSTLYIYNVGPASYKLVYSLYPHLTMNITIINPSYCSYKPTLLSWGPHTVP